MINQPTASELLEKSVNKYELSNIIAKRARQIIDGDTPLVKTKERSPITVASIEFKEDKLKMIDNEEEV